MSGLRIIKKTRLERLFVAWVALALMLMLPLSPWVRLAPSAVDVSQVQGAVTAAGADCADPVAADEDGEGKAFPIQLFEDDILHEDHFHHPLRFSEGRTVHRQVPPETPHPERLERPPAARA